MSSTWKTCWSRWYKQLNLLGMFTWALTPTVFSNKSVLGSSLKYRKMLWCVVYTIKADMSSISNYRPISVLSCLEKVVERVVFKHLYNHFHENSILTPLQSGLSSLGSPIIRKYTKLFNAFKMFLSAMPRE